MRDFDARLEAYTSGELEGEEREAFEVALFSAYLDEELEDAEREAFEAQLEDDPEVSAEFERYRASIQALSGLDLAFAPDNLLREVTTTINKESRGNFFNDRWFFGKRVPFEALIAVMLVVVGAIYFFGNSMRTSAPETLVKVEQPPPEPHEATEPPPGSGQSMGRATEAVTLTLRAEEGELRELAEALRVDGFSVRPEVSSLGPALLVDVSEERGEAFLDRIAAQHEQPAMTPQQLFRGRDAAVLTVRLVLPQ